MKPVIALAGRPNTGKTTLFNALTGLRQRVANFAGTTVEKAVGVLELEDAQAEIVDLPGCFSLLGGSPDEDAALRFLGEAAAEGRDLRVVCVGEASSLHGCLSLALSLKAAGYPVALAVNMIDEARENGVSVNAELLARHMDMPVFLISARTGEGVPALEAWLESMERAGPPRKRLDLRTIPREELKRIHEASLREAEEVAARAVRLPARALLPTVERTLKADRWVFHPILGPVLLGGVLFALFQALFTLGAPLQEALTGGLDAISAALRPHIPSPLLASLACDGVIAGVAAVAAFVPQIAILFLLIGFLEHSGYLPRAGAMVDRALRPFGLDGKVFIPFLSSFACAIPGVMAARTIASEKRRLVAVLLSPLMTCSARIPVYTLVIAAFVPAAWRPWGLSGQGLVMAALYAFGVLTALLLAFALKWTSLFEAHPSPVTVLPPYRLPRAKELAHYVWIRCRHFLLRAGKVIFLLSLVIWALGSFPRAPAGSSPAVQIEQSALGAAGRLLEPVFAPLGYDWKLSVAVLSSMAAREVFVGTLGTLYAMSGESQAEGLAQALARRYPLPVATSLLLFFALALQCVSTIVVVRRETGSWKWPAVQAGTLFVLAYTLAFAGHRLTAAFL